MALFSFLLFVCTIKSLVAVNELGRAPVLTLNDGHQIPQLGLGTWLGPNGNVVFPPDGHVVEEAVGWAIEGGYRHVDTAYIYDTEAQVGKAVADKVAEGIIRREDVFITTKLWNDKHKKEDVVPALRDSLQKLNMTYVDLYLIHWPLGQHGNMSDYDTDYLETWEGMVEAKRLNLTRSIGVSNFNQQQLNRLLSNTEHKPAVLQIEVNLNLQQHELLSYCRQHRIVVTAYTPFGSLFRNKAREDAPPPRDDDPILVAMANKYKKTVPQVVLRYLLDLGIVVIPKSVKKERLLKNIDVFDFKLTEAESNMLQEFDQHFRTINPTFWSTHKYYPF